MNLRDAQHFRDVKLRFPQPLNKLFTLGALHLSRLQSRNPIRSFAGRALFPVTRVHV
jgi:hypothetical protein